MDAGEDYATAVLRESREETGLEIEITGLAGATQFEMPKANVVLLCMEARVAGGELKLSEEHDDFTWIPLNELSRLSLADQVKDFMFDYAARKSRESPPC